MDWIDTFSLTGARAKWFLLIVTGVIALAIVLGTYLTTWLERYKLAASIINTTDITIVNQSVNESCLRVLHPTTLLFTSTITPVPVKLQFLPKPCQSADGVFVLTQHNTITPNALITRTIVVAVNNNFRLIDQKGDYINPQFIYQRDHLPATQPPFYLEPVSSPFQFPFTNPIVLNFVEKEFLLNMQSFPLNMRYESQQYAFWRYFVQTLVDNGIAIIIALFPIGIGIVVAFQKAHYEFWKAKIDTIKVSLDEATEYHEGSKKTKHSLTKFVKDYLEFQHQFRSYWIIPEIKNYYKQVHENLRPKELFVFLEITAWPQLDPARKESKRDFLSKLLLDSIREEDRINGWVVKARLDATPTQDNSGEVITIERALEWVRLESDFENEIKLVTENIIEEFISHGKISSQFLEDLRNQIHQVRYFAIVKTWSLLLYPSEQWVLPEAQEVKRYTRSINTQFYTTRAENDLLLFSRLQKQRVSAISTNPDLQLEWLQKIANEPNSCLIIGEKGAGKTAASLLITYHLAKQLSIVEANHILPIYWRYELHSPSIQQNLLSFSRILAKTLTGYLAANPEGFLNASFVQQNAIASLLALHVNIEVEFALVCTHAQLHHYRSYRKMLATLKEFQSKIDYTALALYMIDSTHLVQLCAKAFPAYNEREQLIARLVLIDVLTPLSLQVTSSLLKTIDLLWDHGFLIKAFLPQQIINDSWRGKIYQISWRKAELRGFLKIRLSNVDDDTLGTDDLVELKSFFRRDIKIETIEEKIYMVGQSLPGPILCIVNALIEKFEEKKQKSNNSEAYLDEEEADEIFSKFTASA